MYRESYSADGTCYVEGEPGCWRAVWNGDVWPVRLAGYKKRETARQVIRALRSIANNATDQGELFDAAVAAICAEAD